MLSGIWRITWHSFGKRLIPSPLLMVPTLLPTITLLPMVPLLPTVGSGKVECPILLVYRYGDLRCQHMQSFFLVFESPPSSTRTNKTTIPPYHATGSCMSQTSSSGVWHDDERLQTLTIFFDALNVRVVDCSVWRVLR